MLCIDTHTLFSVAVEVYRFLFPHCSIFLFTSRRFVLSLSLYSWKIGTNDGSRTPSVRR